MRDREATYRRATLRSWLRRAIQLGLLAKLPREYDRGGSIDPVATSEYAQELLAALREPGRMLLAQTLAEAQSFRAWADARLRDSRKTLLSEGLRERIDMDRLAPPRRTPPPAEKPTQPPPHLRAPREPNPLWDRWLDG